MQLHPHLKKIGHNSHRNVNDFNCSLNTGKGKAVLFFWILRILVSWLSSWLKQQLNILLPKPNFIQSGKEGIKERRNTRQSSVRSYEENFSSRKESLTKPRDEASNRLWTHDPRGTGANSNELYKDMFIIQTTIHGINVSGPWRELISTRTDALQRNSVAERTQRRNFWTTNCSYQCCVVLVHALFINPYITQGSSYVQLKHQRCLYVLCVCPNVWQPTC